MPDAATKISVFQKFRFPSNLLTNSPMGWKILLLIVAVAVVWQAAVSPLGFLSPTSALAVAALATLIVAVSKFLGDVTALIDRASSWWDRATLRKALARGPFDRATIEASMRWYIRPDCCNIDPAAEVELRHALFAVRSDLFEAMEHFLTSDDVPNRHLFLLADSGIGKTSFLLNYFAYSERLRAIKRAPPIAMVALNVPGSDERIREVKDKDRHVLFLDAFDEDTKAIADHHQRIRDLMAAASEFKRVVITCRSQFFARDEEIPLETGVVRVGPRPAGVAATYEFVKLYIAPFSEKQVNDYLRRRFPVWQHQRRARAQALAQSIRLLSARAMLLAHIPDLVSARHEVSREFELYEEMVNAWLMREATWAEPRSLRALSERLAVDMFIRRAERGMERIPVAELRTIATSAEPALHSSVVTGRSLLNRDAAGNFKFAHRSIMEYLFVVQILKGNEACFGVHLTDQMKSFLCDMLSPSELCAAGLGSAVGRFRNVLVAKSSAKFDDESEALARAFRQACGYDVACELLKELGGERQRQLELIKKTVLAAVKSRNLRGATDTADAVTLTDNWFEWLSGQSLEDQVALAVTCVCESPKNLSVLRTPSPVARRVVEMAKWLSTEEIEALSCLDDVELIPLYWTDGECALRLSPKSSAGAIERARLRDFSFAGIASQWR